MVVATGFDLDKEQVFVHDPYSFTLLEQIWVDMVSEAGWGRVTLAVDNKKTGLPDNL